jgi:hypothetical protein
MAIDIDGLDWMGYNDFSGGENVDAHPDNLADNEVEVGENVDFNIAGGFETRLGCTALNEESYGAQVEQVFEWLKPDGTAQLMAMIGNSFHKVANDGTATLIQAMGGAGKLPNFPFQTNLYIIDYMAGNYYTYNGTTLSEVIAADGADLNFVKNCKFAVWHDKSYRWLFGGNSSDKIGLMYSEANEPNNVQPGSILYPTRAMGNLLGLPDFAGNIIAFYKYGARIWRGTDPELDVEWARIPLPEGTHNNFSNSLTPGSLTYMGNSGLWMITPAVLNYNVTIQTANDLVPNLAFGKQTKNIIAASKVRPDLACSVYDPLTGLLFVAYTKTAGATRNNRVMVHRWGTRAFWHYTGWQVNDWCLRANGDLLFAGNGYIYKVRTGTSDAGMTIDQKVDCKRVNLGRPNNHKTVGKLLVESGPVAEVSTTDIEIKSVEDSHVETNVPLTTTRLWTDPWNSPWGSRDSLLTEINFDPPLTGKKFQVKYRNDRIDERMLIYGYSFGSIPSAPIGERR